MKFTPVLALKIPDRETLRSSLFYQGETFGIFVPGNLDLSVGADLLLQLSINDKRELSQELRFDLPGKVLWKRHAASGDLKAGVGVALLEQEYRNELIYYARGESVFQTGRAPRYPVALEIKYKATRTVLSNVTQNISEQGALVLTDETLSIGQRIKLRLYFPGKYFPMKLAAKVCWHQEREPRGVGVIFPFKKRTPEAEI